MEESGISISRQLDAQLLAREVKERTRLWRIAEGRLGWRGAVPGLIAVLIVLCGIALRIAEQGLSGFFESNADGYLIGAGLVTLWVAQWGNTQRQIGALRELIRNPEPRR